MKCVPHMWDAFVQPETCFEVVPHMGCIRTTVNMFQVHTTHVFVFSYENVPSTTLEVVSPETRLVQSHELENKAYYKANI
jgi:hypothetical protein